MKQLTVLATTCLVLLLTSFGCEKADPNPVVPGTPTPNTPAVIGQIRFDSLKVGQRSKFLELLGEDYNNSFSNQFSYTDDTLQLDITAEDANGFLVSEKLRYNGDVSIYNATNKDDVYQYYLKVENDTLRIKPYNSTFFSRIFGYEISKQKGLPMAAFTDPQIEVVGWKTNQPYCECRKTGYDTGYELFGETYPLLNVLIENSPMAYDGNGETYVYSPKNGLVRFSTYSWWTSTGYGWDLLPAE